MRIFERSTAWVLVLCLILSLALSMGPVAPEAHAAQYDPYAFTLGPGSGVVPSCYDPYARPFVGWSAHEVGYYEIVRMFKLTNVSEILPTKPENFTPVLFPTKNTRRCWTRSSASWPKRERAWR